MPAFAPHDYVVVTVLQRHPQPFLVGPVWVVVDHGIWQELEGATSILQPICKFNVLRSTKARVKQPGSESIFTAKRCVGRIELAWRGSPVSLPKMSILL